MTVCQMPEITLANGHQQAGGNALAGDIGDGNAHPVLIQLKNIIEVPPHLLGRLINTGHLQLWNLGELLWKEHVLDFLRQPKI